MRKMQLWGVLISLGGFTAQSQTEPIRIEGFAQGTTYHITYYDAKNRNLQPEIDQILKDFDQSVSTYQKTSAA